MKILITGGLGFIGKHLSTRLSSLGHKVFIIDKPDQKVPPDLNFYGIDITDKESVISFTEEIDFIIHAAAQSTGYYSQIDHVNDCLCNSLGTINICYLARKLQVKKVIYLSTMAVYGNGENRHENSPLTPLSNYGVSKLSGEFYIKTLKQYGIEYSIFRLWNTYGPGQDMDNPRNGIVSVYLAQALNSTIIKVTGSLQRFRDLVYIDDCVSALLLGLNARCNSQTYNICNSNKIYVKDMLDSIQSHFPEKDISIEVVDSHDGDQAGSTGDNKKLLQAGWKPLFNFPQGLENFVQHEK